MVERMGSKNRFATALLAACVLYLLIAAASAQDNATNYANKNADYWYKRGLEQADIGAHEKALDDFNKAIQLDPENPAIWNSKARTLRSLSFSQNDPEKYQESLQAYDYVVQLYDKILQNNDRDVNAYYYKGLALTDKAVTIRSAKKFNISASEADSYFENAIASFDQAIDINPQYITAWIGKGDALYSLGRYNDSLQAYDSALEIFGSDGIAWHHRGRALFELGRFQEAISSYDTALQTFPRNAEIWLNKGRAFLGQGNYDEAIKSFDYSLKLNPSMAESWYYKGQAFEKLGLNTSAEASFAKAQSMGCSA